MVEARKNIKQGFLWLGVASGVTQVLDIASSFIVLWYLSLEDMGLATLSWSFAVILESFNGLGIGTAIVQKPDLNERQVSSAFWFSTLVSIFLFSCIALASPMIATYYHSPELIAMSIFAGAKLLFVGLALVPLQLLNKELKFQEVSAIQMFASLFSVIIKITLAVIGFGAFALVYAHMSYGIFLLAATYYFKPFRPMAYCNFSEIAPLIKFGLKVTASSSIYHFYRNADYLIVGKFLGKEALGIYRVAFDIAMTPALAVLNIVNRAGFPVLARLTGDEKKMRETFLWMQSRVALFVIPIMVFLIFCSADIVQLIADGKWIEAIPVIQVLAVAALLRCIAQTFPQLFHANARSELAVYDSIAAFAILIVSFSVAISFYADSIGIKAIAYAWVMSYPLLIYLLMLFSKKIICITWKQFFLSFYRPLWVFVVTLFSAIGSYQLNLFLGDYTISNLVLQSATILLATLLYIRLTGAGGANKNQNP